MGKKKAKEPAMGTSLGDLLFQKNLGCGTAAEQDARVAELQLERSALEDRKKVLEERIEALQRTTDLLEQEVHRLTARVRELQEGRSALTSELFERAVGELKGGNFLHALGLLQAFLLQEPEHARAMINLAVAYAELGFHQSAVEVLQQVLARDPHNEMARRNLGVLMGEAVSQRKV